MTATTYGSLSTVDWINVRAFGATGNGVTDDTAAIQAAINAVPSGGVVVYIPAGDYLLNSSALSMATAGTVLLGDGAENTKLLVGSSFTGTTAVQITGYNCQVRDLSVSGNNSTTTSNPVANGIEITGVRRTRVSGCQFWYLNGWAIEAVATTAGSTSNPLGTQISQVFMNSCAGGVHFVGNTTQAWAMNCQVSDMQFYLGGVTTGASANLDAIRIEDSWDILVENAIAWMSNGTGSSLHIKGNSAASFITNLDALGPHTGPCVLIEDSTNGSPQNVQIQGGVIQQGAPGLLISGGAVQVHIATTRIINNQTHGIQVNGTGKPIHVYNCLFNLNGAGASGTNYDLDWSGTSQGKVIACWFGSNIVTTGSAGVQQSCNIASSGQAILFEAAAFQGSGASSSNWFNGNLPAGVFEASGGAVNFATSVAFSSTGTSATTKGNVATQPSALTNTVLSSNLNGTATFDTFRLTGDGKLAIGPGGTTGTRDTFIGRSANGTGYVEPNLLVGSATALGDNGSGELQLANATTVPTTNPTGGVSVYSTGGVLRWRDPSGNIWQPETFFNVMAYGATGNGSTDDTTAIQAALNAVPGSGGTVYFPPGTYITSSALSVPASCRLLGAGVNASVVKQTSTTVDGLNGSNITALVIADMQFYGPSSGTGIGIALSLTGGSPTSYVVMRSVRVAHFGSDGINITDPIISSFDDVVASSNGGHGFNVGGATAGNGGTSCAFVACYGLSNTQAGFYLNNLQYSNMSGCGSDSNGTGYYLNACVGVSLNGCGSESSVVGTSPYVGNAFVVNGGYSNSLTSCFVYANPAISFWVTGSASKINLSNCSDNSPTGSATNTVKVDSGSSATVIAGVASSPVSYSSTTQILNDGSGNAQTYGQVLAKTSGAVALAAMQLGVATSINFIVTPTGVIQIGPGSATADTQIARTGVGQMTLTNKSTAHAAGWLVDGNVVIGGTSTLGDNGAGELQVADASTVPTTNPTAGTVVYSQSAAATPLKLRDTAGNVRGLVDAFVEAPSNQTSTATSQTASTYLTLAVEASAMYVMELGLVFGESSASGIFTPSWTGPSGATMQWCDTGTSGDYSSTIGATNNTYTGSANPRMAFLKGLLVTSTTAGSLTLTFATNNTFTATVYSGSYLKLTRVK